MTDRRWNDPAPKTKQRPPHNDALSESTAMTEQDKAAIERVERTAQCVPFASVATTDLRRILALAKLGAAMGDEAMVERVARAIAKATRATACRPDIARAAIAAIKAEATMREDVR